MKQKGIASNPPEIEDAVILLVGSGASSCLGLPTLESIIDPHIGVKLPLNSKVMNTIRQTWEMVPGLRGREATFEEVIAKLKSYSESATLLAKDQPFRSALANIPHQVNTGEFERIWKDCLIECYRILLEYYGPKRINPNSEEFRTTIKFFKKLSTFNNQRLHIFTTNYDCSFHVIASNTDELSFITHIDSNTGCVRDNCYYQRLDLQDKDIPLLYIHRLHGCVAWFLDPRAPYKLREIYGAGANLEIRDENLLSEMCIKLVSSEQLGINPAFSLAFHEFYEQLKSCKVLLVWGHSFRDIEVLRTINNAIETQSQAPKILYLDPYLTEQQANESIRSTLAGVPGGIGNNIIPEDISRVVQDGNDKLISNTIKVINRSLKEREKYVEKK